jgi:hypothetical protein
MKKTFGLVAVAFVVAGFSLSAQAADAPQPGLPSEPFKILGNQPDSDLSAKIKDIFARSDEILIRYSGPWESEDPVTYKKEEIEKRWKFAYGLHCQGSCDYNSYLQSILSVARGVEPACPSPLTILVILRNGGNEVNRIYVSNDGKCYLLGDKWYFSEKSIKDYLPRMPTLILMKVKKD